MTGLDTDTIAAIATARGNGPVGIIRLSGPDSLAIALALSGSELTPRYAHYRSFLDNEGQTIDSGLAIFFPGPNSFTGEDVVEIQVHGGHGISQYSRLSDIYRGLRTLRLADGPDIVHLNTVAKEELKEFGGITRKLGEVISGVNENVEKYGKFKHVPELTVNSLSSRRRSRRDSKGGMKKGRVRLPSSL